MIISNERKKNHLWSGCFQSWCLAKEWKRINSMISVVSNFGIIISFLLPFGWNSKFQVFNWFHSSQHTCVSYFLVVLTEHLLKIA